MASWDIVSPDSSARERTRATRSRTWSVSAPDMNSEAAGPDARESAGGGRSRAVLAGQHPLRQRAPDQPP